MADEQACPPFQCTLVFRACCPCFLISFCLCCPFDTEVHLALNTLCFHFLSCSCLPEDVFHFTFFAFVEVFQVPPVTSWPTASSLVLSFSAISYSGDEPQRMTWQRIGGKGGAARLPSVSWRVPSPANTCLKVFGQTAQGSFCEVTRGCRTAQGFFCEITRGRRSGIYAF